MSKNTTASKSVTIQPENIESVLIVFFGTQTLPYYNILPECSLLLAIYLICWVE